MGAAAADAAAAQPAGDDVGAQVELGSLGLPAGDPRSVSPWFACIPSTPQLPEHLWSVRSAVALGRRS